MSSRCVVRWCALGLLVFAVVMRVNARVALGDDWGTGPIDPAHGQCSEDAITDLYVAEHKEPEGPPGVFFSVSDGRRLTHTSGGEAFDAAKRMKVGDKIQLCLIQKTYCLSQKLYGPVSLPVYPGETVQNSFWAKRGGVWESTYRVYDHRTAGITIAGDSKCGPAGTFLYRK